MKTKYFRLARYLLSLSLLLASIKYGMYTPTATDYELMTSHPLMSVIIIMLIVNEGLLIKFEWD